jgi:hypothetical protein
MTTVKLVGSFTHPTDSLHVRNTHPQKNDLTRERQGEPHIGGYSLKHYTVKLSAVFTSRKRRRLVSLPHSDDWYAIC